MRSVRVVGVPLDLGASRRGVDMGPYAVRAAGLAARLRALGHSVDDAGNLSVPDRGTFPAESHGLEFLPAIASVCRALADETFAAASAGKIPLVLGGDHSLAAGSVAGVARAARKRGERVGLIWIDAHADLNTPSSSISGNVHGMPLAALIGHGDKALADIAGGGAALKGEHVALVGIRDLDAGERAHIREWGVQLYSMRDIDQRGLGACVTDAIARVSEGTSGFCCSFDADAVDPSAAPGVGTPVRGGLTFREAHLALELIADTGKLLGLDIVEVNPILDVKNETAELAVGLAASALGQRIV
ncbi:MAG TPA: arginase [Gemmatimonadaceae bacterium]|nr:arginase [Gemmatimonadaceae bacterium]